MCQSRFLHVLRVRAPRSQFPAINGGIRIADKVFVAKKFYAPGLMLRDAVQTATMNWQMATMPLAGIRVPPRIRTIPAMRRRLPVTMVSDPPEFVRIRQAVQNIDSNFPEPRPLQSPRV